MPAETSLVRAVRILNRDKSYNLHQFQSAPADIGGRSNLHQAL